MSSSLPRLLVGLELEADAAGQQRHDELIQADALVTGASDESGVEAGRHSDEDMAAGRHVANSSAYAIDPTSSTCDTSRMSNLSMSDAQRTLLANLQAKVLQGDDDYREYHDRLVEKLDGDPYVTVDGRHAWRPKYLASEGEEINRTAASACIDVLKAMDIPRCSGYCHERGVQHSKVRYYDDHYDYECGLS